MELKRCLRTVKQEASYNLEKSQASTPRLNTLILLITLADSRATLQGRKLNVRGFKNTLVALLNRVVLSAGTVVFGLYAQSSVGIMEYCQDLVEELIKARRNKLPFFHQEMRAMSLILSMT